MSSSRLRALSGLLVVILAAAGSTAGQTPQPPVLSGEGLPEGPGKDVTVKACAPCHEARRAASVRLTREGWAAVIDGMQKRGAKVSEQEFPVILDYLATHFLGEALQPLNLNTASQIDLETAGGLLRREARCGDPLPRAERPVQDRGRLEEGAGARLQEDRKPARCGCRDVTAARAQYCLSQMLRNSTFIGSPTWI